LEPELRSVEEERRIVSTVVAKENQPTIDTTLKRDGKRIRLDV